MKWKPEQVALLMKLHEGGRSFERISEATGHTTSACIGKYHYAARKLEMLKERDAREHDAQAKLSAAVLYPSLRRALEQVAADVSLVRLNKIVHDELGAVMRNNRARAEAEGWIL